MDYYNDLCFEFIPRDTQQKSQSAIIAGGRYDKLAEMLVGKPHNMPACGWAAGIERIIDYITTPVESSTNNKVSLANLDVETVGVLLVIDKGNSSEFNGQIMKGMEIILKYWE